MSTIAAIAELKELARAATPGPWVADDTTFDDGPSTGWFREGPGRVDTGEYNTLSWADAAFIAACDPATISRLCDMAELGEAWAEAEAAVPEGWTINGLVRDGDRWLVHASARYEWAIIQGTERLWRAEIFGPTPAAALHALAAKLRET